MKKTTRIKTDLKASLKHSIYGTIGYVIAMYFVHFFRSWTHALVMTGIMLMLNILTAWLMIRYKLVKVAH